MAYEKILVEQRGRVGLITMNRPDQLNAWSPTMEAEIREVAAAWDADPGVGAIVFTGAGRGYCAGADVGGFAQGIEARTAAAADGAGAAPRRRGSGWTQFVRTLQTPTIAAVNGVAAGMGVTTTLSMDIRIASHNARFGFVFVKIGVTPELGSTYYLPQLVGLGKATEWCLTGRFVAAQEALDTGLVTEVVAPENLVDRAVELGAAIAANPSPQIRFTRQLLRRNLMNHDVEDVIASESELFAAAQRTWEHKEAVSAFLQKRTPDFDRQPPS